MAWYSTGTVTVTNGSRTVTGAGTAFVANVVARDAFMLVGGQPCEIARVVSDTQLELERPWLGASSGGAAYVIQPTVGIYVDLALRALGMLTPFQGVLDGIGQGLVADRGGTLALRFLADQDTGFRRPAEDTLAIVTGGADRLIVDPNGFSLAGRVSAVAAGAAVHRLVKPDETAVGARIAGFGYAGFGDVAYFSIQGGTAANGAASTLWLNAAQSTGRSINAGGTVNTSGADYAEYMIKAAGCGTIAAGQVCGVTSSGELTLAWADAVAYVVKSTNPSYVGGDTWASHLPPQPERGEQEAVATFALRLGRWEDQHEAARRTVDRIAFCGQVPVDVDGSFAPGDYMIADQDGDGIRAIAVPDADITFLQYRRRLGRVWAVRDGRAWIDVQHG